MGGFISEVAEKLYEKYGGDISSLHVLFPSKRARLFFAEALARVADKPLWQPVYTSIDEVMEGICGIKAGDRIRLVSELYTIYSRYHREPFDSFYFWGETLLSDFDSIDKYLIDAGMLFSNIADLKALDNDFSSLDKEQREIIERFWRSFGQQADASQEKQKFMDVWQTLGPIYVAFRERLAQMGVAYTGMIHRMAVEKLAENKEITAPRKRYVIAGFNALSECERKLFDHLSRNHEVEFFWDYDEYYINDSEQEAGLFLRDNIARFPQTTPLPHSNRSFTQKKNITVIESPSDALQCKYAGEFVAETMRCQGGAIGKETAIVLTDENLLLPVLSSIPDRAEEINVTMGYPLRNSLEYSFVERLIELQTRKRSVRGKTSFYHSDVTGLLTHPFVAQICGGAAAALSRDIIARQRVYVEGDKLTGSGLFDRLFTAVEGWRAMVDYITGILSQVAQTAEGRDDAGQRTEFIATISEHVTKLRNSLEQCSIEVSERIFASLLRRMLQTLTIPYQGEPLVGLQVMGILETRNLDFENVVILSVNDDTFPGNRTSPSFIPHNLRFAYGLPTPAHHEGVFAYYFYRLLQRAKNIHIVYCSRSDDKSTGEQSRYIYQLDYESSHEIERRAIALDANLAPTEPIVIEKSQQVLAQLDKFTVPGGRKLSPTAFYAYLQCPLKFYFRSVARLRKDDEVAEDVDSPLFGTILHRAMELLYTPLVGVGDPSEALRVLIGSDKVVAAVDRAINDEYLHDSAATSKDYGGNLTLIREIVVKYINRCVLPYDSSRTGYRIRELERELNVCFAFESGGVERTVNFTGKADRTDQMPDGTLRVVDYKTGAVHIEFSDIASLFEPQTQKNVSGATLQTFLYSMMLHKSEGGQVQPALYYVRKMSAKEYSPLLMDKGEKRQVERYSDYAEEFEQHLADALSHIFDPKLSFVQCDDRKLCLYCDFREICGR